MATLPYIQLPQSQAPGIIGDIGDSLLQAARMKQEREQQAARNLLDQQRLAADQARMRAEESRAQAEEHRAQASAAREAHQYEAQRAAATAGALPQIHDLLASGDEGSANAIAQAHGIKMQQRPLATTDPGAAPTMPQAPMQGPIPSPEERALSFAGQPGDQSGAAEQAIGEDQRLAAERQQYAQQLSDHPRLMAEHQAHLASYQQAKQNPVYDIETPYGKSTFDLGAVREHQKAQRAQTADTLSQGLPPQYALRAAALVKSGLSPTEASKQIEAQMRSDEDRQMRRDIAGGRNETALQVAALRKKAGGGAGAGPSKMELREAGPVLHEMDKSLEDVTRKGGLAENLIHMQGTLDQLQQQPNNPVVWTNAIDAAIRTNTGRAAIKAQYDLYREHARGVVDSFNSWLESKKSGNLGEAEKKNFRGAFNSGYNEMRAQAKQAYDSFRQYDQDPRVQRNRAIGEGYQARTRNAFSRLPGWGKPEGDKAAEPAKDSAHPAVAPVGEVKTLPNGTKVRKVGPNQWEAVQ